MTFDSNLTDNETPLRTEAKGELCRILGIEICDGLMEFLKSKFIDPPFRKFFDGCIKPLNEMRRPRLPVWAEDSVGAVWASKSMNRWC